MRTAKLDLIRIRRDTRADAEEAMIAGAVGVEPRLHRRRRRSWLPED